jgi:hypothetical protein
MMVVRVGVSMVRAEEFEPEMTRELSPIRPQISRIHESEQKTTDI